MHSSVKLTLRLDKQLINFAKRYSAQQGKSLSQVVAEYFNLLEDSRPERRPSISPITRSLIGILRNSKISEEDYKKYIENKYL